jgi:hypothetical protein
VWKEHNARYFEALQPPSVTSYNSSRLRLRVGFRQEQVLWKELAGG